MPIFDQGYQHWNGRLSGHAGRWLTITEQGVRTQLSRRKTKWLVLSGFAPALLLAVVLVLWGLLENGSTLLEPFSFLIQALPEEIRSGPKAYRASFWILAYHHFFTLQTGFAMLLVLLVGPDLISQDLRFNAMPLYFARPLRRIDYFAGKLGVIAFFLGAVVILPAVIAYALGVAFSFELSVFRDTGPLLLGALGFGLVLTLSAGTLMLAISSLSRNSRVVSAMWVAFWLLSTFTSNALSETLKQDWCPIVSYVRDLGRIREALLGSQSARNQFLDLIEKTQETARAAARASGPFGAFGRRRGGPFAPPPPPPPPESSRERPIPSRFLLESDLFPWTWSAGVLGGLLLLSILVLTTRIKSLDRLK